MKYVIRPSAKDDIIRQYRYYLLAEALDAAGKFLDAVDDSIERICNMPGVGSIKPVQNRSLSGLRVWPVKDFEEILIFYLVHGNTIRVIRVLHGRRDIERLLQKELDPAQ